MQNQRILARISVAKNHQGDLGYFDLVESLNNFGLKKDKEFGSLTFFNVGTKITIENKKYKIKEIQTLFYDHISIGEELEYNFEILYFVEPA